QLAERRAELEAALAEHGFPDAEAARGAALSAPELRALEDAVASYREELARISEGLADHELGAHLAHESFAEVLGVRAGVDLDLEQLDLAALDPTRLALAPPAGATAAPAPPPEAP